MFKTVNLETKMIALNSNVKEKLESLIDGRTELIQQANIILKNSATRDLNLLKEAGFSNAINESEKVVRSQTILQNTLNEFSKSERMFHVSQIKNICVKYRLRCLNIEYYKGSLDKTIPQALVKFKEDFNINVIDKNKMFIVAPSTSFNLEAKPKDPLLLYKVSTDNYYLIKKWGNDLTTKRVYKNFFFRTRWHMLALFILTMIPITLTVINAIKSEFAILPAFAIGAILGMVIFYEDSSIEKWDSAKDY